LLQTLEQRVELRDGPRMPSWSAICCWPRPRRSSPRAASTAEVTRRPTSVCRRRPGRGAGHVGEPEPDRRPSGCRDGAVPAGPFDQIRRRYHVRVDLAGPRD